MDFPYNTNIKNFMYKDDYLRDHTETVGKVLESESEVNNAVTQGGGK
jgi:hypothetical protein